MKRFIRADLATNCTEAQNETGLDNWGQVNAYLKEWESSAVTSVQLGLLNPHVNLQRGHEWKVLVKRIVRKLTWWMVEPLVTGQNYRNEQTSNVTIAIGNCICALKDIVQQQQIEIDTLKRELHDQANELKEYRMKLNELSCIQKSEIANNNDYENLENFFRGNEDAIINRAERCIDAKK